jgi:hypothetical protein
MPPALRFRLDPGLLVAMLLATLAAWPLLTRSSLPTNTDADLHIYRTQQILWSWEQGVLYPRWAPDFAFGFGYPVFNYYAPLTYYIGAAYGQFFGGPVAGVKFVLVVAAYAGAAGLYLFVREIWDSAAAVVSAAAFSLAPYTIYIDPHARGAVPEALALACAPLVLWAFARLRRAPSPGNIGRASIALAALLLAHNLIAFVLAGLLVAWLAWEGIFERGGQRSLWSRVWPSGSALLLGVCLAACMWLPAFLERDAVQFQRAIADVSRPGAALQFVAAPELLSPASVADLGDLALPGWKFRLGLPQWLLAVLGVLTIFQTRARRSTVLFFTGAAMVLTGLVLPASEPLWKALPALTYLQLPWRLLGPDAIVMGVLAGAVVDWATALPWMWSRAAFGSVAVAASLVGALPLLDPLPWADYGPVTPQRLLVFESEGNIGTTAQNEFLPSGVKSMPAPQASLIHSDTIGPVDKVNRARLPEGTQVAVIAHGPQHDRFQISAPADFDLSLFTFYFPGWTAYVDGVRTPVAATDPEGFITFHVPAGERDVLVRLEDTPPRRWGWLISGAACAALAGLAMMHVRTKPIALQVESLGWRAAMVFASLGLLGLGVRYAADRYSPWQIDLRSYNVPEAQHQHLVRLEGNLALLGYDLTQTTAKPGDQIPITLYWKAIGRAPRDLSVFVHVLGADGQLWGQSDKARPVAYFPTDRWPLNRYFVDHHLAWLRPDVPPGDYIVVAGLWDRYTGIRLHLLDPSDAVTRADGIVLADSFKVQP